MALQSWSGLIAGKFKDSHFMQIGEFNGSFWHHLKQKYHKSLAQLLLKFLLEEDILVLVKSENPARMKENLALFDFSFTKDELQKIHTFDKNLDAFKWYG